MSLLCVSASGRKAFAQQQDSPGLRLACGEGDRGRIELFGLGQVKTSRRNPVSSLFCWKPSELCFLLGKPFNCCLLLDTLNCCLVGHPLKLLFVGNPLNLFLVGHLLSCFLGWTLTIINFPLETHLSFSAWTSVKLFGWTSMKLVFFVGQLTFGGWAPTSLQPFSLFWLDPSSLFYFVGHKSTCVLVARPSNLLFLDTQDTH